MLVGPALLATCFLAMAAFGAFPDVGKVFNTDDAIGVGINDISCDGVVDSKLQPVSLVH